MRKKTISSMTSLEFEHHIEEWRQTRDQVMADSMAMPGPGWKPELERLHDEALVLSAERRRRAG
jgi:hypothetical protein